MGSVATVIFTAVAVLSFLVMEPVTYLTHRFVMHGLAERIHRSHHRPASRGWEANDAFPVAFSAVAMVTTIAIYQGRASRLVLAAVVGVTVYGVLYGLVHDAYIHRRLPLFRRRHPVLDRLADAHRIHHLYNGEPYGMLMPVVPSELRERASHSRRDPLGRAT